MTYVVPVAEEHAEEIGHFVMTLSRKDELDAWPSGAVTGLVAALRRRRPAGAARPGQQLHHVVHRTRHRRDRTEVARLTAPPA